MLAAMAGAPHVYSVIGTKGAESTVGAALAGSGVDAAIAELAERQHGVVGRAQLLELGVGARAVTHRLERRRLHPLHRGVYAVGQTRLVAEASLIAAVLACGPEALLSHRSAGALCRSCAQRRRESTSRSRAAAARAQAC